MALQAVREGARDLVIVPLGLNYECKERFRSSVWIRVGEPIQAARWLEDHAGDDRRAMRRLTQEIDHRLKGAVVHLDEEKWEGFLDDLEVLRPAPPDRARLPSAALRQRKRIADGMNYFLATDRARAEGVAGAIERHRARLAEAKLSIGARLLRLRGIRLVWSMGWEGFWLLAGLVPAVFGLVHHLLPFLLVQGLAPRLKAPGRSTLALTRLGLSIPLYAIWYVLVSRWMMRHFAPWAAWSWAAAMPLAGLFALHYFRRLRADAGLRWHELRTLFRPSQLEQFRCEQLALSQQLDHLAAEYAKVSPPETTQGDAY